MADVLVVDDDGNNRLLLATLLKHAGHTPIECGDANSAIAAASRYMPALIIVDLSLPDLPGAALIRRLRSDPKLARSKIALHTATQTDAAIRELVDLYDLCAVIPKPGDPKELLSVFAQLLG